MRAAFRLVLALLLASGAFTADVAAGHSEIRSSQPSPGQSVGGEVEMIYVDFFTAITEPTATLSDPDGNELAGRIGRPNDFSFVYELDAPLSVEGQHILRYETTAYDGFREESALAFSFDETAEEFELSIPDPPNGSGVGGNHDDGFDWPLVIGVWLIALGVGLLGLWYIRERRKA